MKGLLLKEIAMIGGQMRSWLIAWGIMCFYSIFMKSNSIMYMYIALCGIMSTMSLFSLDQVSRWDSYVLCLPLKRRDVVEARYLFGIIFALFIGITGFFLLCICSALRREHLPLGASLLRLYLVFAGTIAMQSVMLPVLYRFEAEKARYICMAIYVLPVLGAVNLAKWMECGGTLAGIMHKALLISPVLLVVLVMISFIVSVRIYRRKDV